MINLANEVFGFNGWSSSIQNVQIDFVDENANNGRIALGLSVIVRVTIRDGTFHEDIGYGSVENVKGKGAAFEKAKKEGCTDALKRALRTFGNVLGNCLYDKDYLTKIQKVKVQPTKWDTERLHRHADFAPVKQEGERNSVIDDGQKRIQQNRQPSNQSGNSFGSIEFEEDFGGNAFDETDFSHPDEVMLDDTTIETPGRGPVSNPAQSSSHARQSVPRMQSMPHMRPQSLQSPASVQNPQPAQHMQGPYRPPTNLANVPPSRLPPPQQQDHQQPQPRQALESTSSKFNPSLANQTLGSSTSKTSNQVIRDHAGFGGAGTDGESSDPPAPRMPPAGNPDGFVTGRSADFLNLPPGARPPNAAVPFNPNAEASSIRRTQGLNPGKSAPVTRSSVQQTGSAVINSANSNAQYPPLQQQPQRPQSPAIANGPATNLQNGVTTPGRADYVNPSVDAHRRIGMPQPAGGLQNRGGYRPPSMLGNAATTVSGVKRPALTDVSNLQHQQLDGTSDVKKPKVDEEAGLNDQTSDALAASGETVQ